MSVACLLAWFVLLHITSGLIRGGGSELSATLTDEEIDAVVTIEEEEQIMPLSMTSWLNGLWNFSFENATCSSFPKCQAMNMTTMDCCPNNENLILSCCLGPITCEATPKCNDMNFTGECCPTSNNTMLDCCFNDDGSLFREGDAVPDPPEIPPLPNNNTNDGNGNDTNDPSCVDMQMPFLLGFLRPRGAKRYELDGEALMDGGTYNRCGQEKFNVRLEILPEAIAQFNIKRVIFMTNVDQGRNFPRIEGRAPYDLYGSNQNDISCCHTIPKGVYFINYTVFTMTDNSGVLDVLCGDTVDFTIN